MEEGIMGKRVVIALVLALAVSSIGCRTNEYWTFGVTRECFRGGGLSGGGGSGGEALLVALAVILAIDILMLPITVGHDLWLYHRNGFYEEGNYEVHDQEIPYGTVPTK
jgi:hypothetical protein